jgi:protein-(glutamine-N5) methyltransferase, release factor-specific
MKDHRADAIRRLADAGIDSPRLDVRLLWDASQRNPGIFESFIKRRLAHEPVAYIVGYKEFWSLEFIVEPGVLIPRPATETIIEQVFDRYPDIGAPLKILDLGTGSGCLLTALLKEYPNARGLGIDESEKALSVAARNIERNGVQARAELKRGNWMENLDGGWDVIVSNPPYIPTGDIAGLDPDVRDYEPLGALDGGPDGLDAVRALAAGFRRLLKGTAFVEIGIGQAESAQILMADAGLSVHHIASDLAGIPRVVVTGR